jgi:hypothetical protein
LFFVKFCSGNFRFLSSKPPSHSGALGVVTVSLESQYRLLFSEEIDEKEGDERAGFEAGGRRGRGQAETAVTLSCTASCVHLSSTSYSRLHVGFCMRVE